MELKPVNDMIVVDKLPQDAVKQSDGRIFLPNRTAGEPDFAVVIAVGPGRVSEGTGQTMPRICEPGDLVLVYPASGHPVTMDPRANVVHWVLNPGHVMCKVEGVELTVREVGA